MNKIFIFICFLCAGISAKANAGKIEGKVVDEKNVPITGAIVKLDGTAIGASSDFDGKYLLKNIPIGNYTLSISYVSYDKKVITDIKVENDGLQTINVSLTKSNKNLGGVTVKASIKRENLNALLIQQKNLATISDGVSAESIKRTPDRSSGDVLKRISGVSITDGKFAVVRGLMDRYNLAMLNGSVLPSSESDRKAFSFDMFPSNMLDQIVIVKAATPDMQGEFAGGVIEIISKDIPSQNFLQAQIGTGINTKGTFKSYNDSKNGKLDWLGISDNSRKLPENFPTTDSFNSNSYSNEKKYEATNSIENNWSMRKLKSMMPNRVMQISGGFAKELKKETVLGVIAAVSYNRSQRLNIVDRKEFEIGNTPTAYYTDTVARDQVLAGALLNVGLKLQGKHKINFRNMLNANSEDQTITRYGENLINQQLIKANAFYFNSNRLLSSQLSGDHILSKYKIKLQWNGAYHDILRNVPDFRRMYYLKNTNDAEDTTWTANIPINRGSPLYAGKFYYTLKEKVYNGRVDITLPFDVLHTPQLLRVGVYYQNKNRTFDSRVLGYAISKISTFNNQYLDLPQDQIFNQQYIGDKGFRIDDITEPSNHYTAKSSLKAAYVMLDNSLFKNLRIVYGVRIENFEQELNSSIMKGVPYQVKKNNTNLLPSLNMTYALNKKTNLRFCASQTLSRPEFRELARFTFFDFNTNSVLLGNENLEQTKIQNYDVRYEVYPGQGEILSASLFYKRFDSPIEQYVKSFRDRSYRNAKLANSYGVEIEGRKSFAFMTDQEKSWWNYLTVFGNVAFIKSKVEFKTEEAATNKSRPMQGQSPYLVNMGMSFIHPDHGFGLTLLYNRIGERLFEVGTIQVPYPDVYEKARDIVDLQISKTFYKKLEVRLSYGDILKQPYVYFQNDDFGSKYKKSSNIIAQTNIGSSIGLSATYKF